MIMASCVDTSNGGGSNIPLATPPPPRVPAILGPASPSLRALNEADGTNRTNDRRPPADMGEEEDSRNIHRRNLKRKQPEGGGTGDNADGSSRSATGYTRNVRRRRRERSAVHDVDEAAGAGNSKEPPAQIRETLGWENKVTPGPKDHAVDAKAIAADMEAKYRDGVTGGGNGGREDRAGETRPIQQPPVPRQLRDDCVRKPAAAAPNQPLVVPVVGERTKYRHASLSTEDDSAEDDVDPNRPCRVIQFVTVTHRRQLMQALQCNGAATEGYGARQSVHLRWREEVGLATAAKKRGIGSGSRSTSEGGNDDHSTASDSTNDYSASSSSSSTANSHACDASSVDSDLTTDPRLFVLSTSAAAARVSAADGETDVAYPLAEKDDDEDDDADNEHRGGRHYRLNLPPEVAWKALIVLSVLVILLDLIYSTVADVVIRVVNRPRRTNRQPQPPAPAPSAAKGEVDLLANSKELER
jgi:hypothetical protein